ncbi:MAG: pteridine reductase [Pseudohongiellaceae bacterium]
MGDTTTPVALVTGSARRIGAAIVREFHGAGCHVIVHCHRSVREGQQLIDTLNEKRPGSARLLQADLTDHDAVLTLAEQVLQGFGRLDVLVHNASRFYTTPLGESTLRQWDDLIDSNARAAWFLTRSLAPALQDSRGSIVNLVDINAARGMSGFGPYTMAKSALEAMTRTLARELAPQVRVNAVAPGAILWPESMEDSPAAAAKQQKMLAGIPAGRLGTEREIATAVYFLARRAHYVTGQTLRVDGGRSLS